MSTFCKVTAAVRFQGHFDRAIVAVSMSGSFCR